MAGGNGTVTPPFSHFSSTLASSLAGLLLCVVNLNCSDFAAEMRTLCPEKMNVDDLPLSKSDKPEAFGGVTSHYVPSSHGELNHMEVGHGQSEKLKLMQSRKEKKLSRLKAGVIDSGEISGNKGDRSIEELLEFINSKETEQGRSRRTSQKAKKQPVVALPNKSRMNFTIQVTVTDEILYNWQTPEATNAVPNGFLAHDESKECEDVKEAEKSVKVIEESSNDSYTVTVLGSTSNGFAAQAESGECAETVDRPESIPSLADAVSTVANGFQERKELGGIARAEKKNRKEKSAFQASSANATVQPSYAVAEQALTDTVTVSGSSSFKYTSDSSSEAVATDDNDSSRDFTVVQKKKRNKNMHAEKSESSRAKSSSLDVGRSKMQNGRKVDDSFKVFPAKHNQQYRKSAHAVDNKLPVHSAWSALLKDKPMKGEVLGKNSSGDSSETSSVCSASVQRESTSFNKIALGNTASDAASQSVRKNLETSVVFHRGETRTLQSAKNACELQQNADAACGGNITSVVSPRAVDQCHSSSQDTVVIPTSTDNGFRQDLSTFTDTGLGSDLNKVSLPTDKVASCHSSTSHQETALSLAAASESSRALVRPVVFDTREKSRFLAPASDIEISFGFDADDEGTPKAEAELTDSPAIPSAKEAKSNSVHCSQMTPDPANCNAVLDINCNHPHFQGSINKSAVIALPSHGFQPSASHVPLIYSSPHHFSIGYVLPVGIVPPFMTCSSRPLPSATAIPHPAFESKDIMAPFPDVSIESASRKQEQEQHGTEICVQAPAQLMVSPVPEELPSARSPESSKLEGRSTYFDLAAAQAFLYSGISSCTNYHLYGSYGLQFLCSVPFLCSLHYYANGFCSCIAVYVVRNFPKRYLTGCVCLSLRLFLV